MRRDRRVALQAADVIAWYGPVVPGRFGFRLEPLIGRPRSERQITAIERGGARHPRGSTAHEGELAQNSFKGKRAIVRCDE